MWLNVNKKGYVTLMKVPIYHWHETDSATRARIMARAQSDIDAVVPAVQKIIEDVRARGDQALIEYARQFDRAELASIQVSAEEFERAEHAVPGDLKAAIQHCVDNVKRFHEEQMRRVEDRWMIEVEPGVWAGEQVAPIPSVGLYVPRGKGAFPSAMYMLCIPAVLAQVPHIAVVTPPTPAGSADDASLYTAQLCGVKTVYKVGGAQAIAALAYGTQSVVPVKKVLGPGSPYVAAAKRLLAHVIDPGMPAGPSESIVLCDETAHPQNTCLDLLNEAEHGADSAALLVTHDETLALFVQKNLPGYIEALPEPHRGICRAVMGGGYGGIILTRSLDESIDFANAYAPEHLHLKVKDPDRVIPRLVNAGEILMGEYTPSTLGNYGIGVNHVLPTGGWAATYSCTGVWDFLKRTSLAKVERAGFESLKDTVSLLTDYEDFPAHGDTLRKRAI